VQQLPDCLERLLYHDCLRGVTSLILSGPMGIIVHRGLAFARTTVMLMRGHVYGTNGLCILLQMQSTLAYLQNGNKNQKKHRSKAKGKK
jgi:hypothetical protein